MEGVEAVGAPASYVPYYLSNKYGFEKNVPMQIMQMS
jgi:hypothetical protein